MPESLIYKKFIEAIVPGTACNFTCSYCYVAQAEGVEKRALEKSRFDAETIGYALRKERIGGSAYINICGVGETLLPRGMPGIIMEILKQGHFVNIYTNGTVTSSIDQICAGDKNLLRRLCFSFSLHWIELKERNLLNVFSENIRKVRAAGCSIVCNMVLDDSYLPFLNEIRQWSIQTIGACPQLSFPKKWNNEDNYSPLTSNIAILQEKAKSFQSPYFDFTSRFYNYDRKKFCYAGRWSFVLNLFTGDISQCYGSPVVQNIYKNLESKIKQKPIGFRCKSGACGGGLFLPMGVVPAIPTPSYEKLKNRATAQWYSHEFAKFLSQQLSDNNKSFSAIIEHGYDLGCRCKSVLQKGVRFFMRICLFGKNYFHA